MSYEPCYNPSCKSYGKSHPNCRCHGSFAEGGEVGSFCGGNRAHSADCEHYSKGLDDSHFHNGYMAEGGLVGILNLHKHHPEKAMQHYHEGVGKGHKKVDSHIESIFGGDSPKEDDYSKHIKSIEEWLEKGGVEHNLSEELYNGAGNQNYAEGGKVEKRSNEGIHSGHPIEREYPEQNMMLQMTKGRASQYLNSLKPQKFLPKLAFDREPDQRQQKKAYDKALKIAANPMQVVSKIKKGSISPDDVKNLDSLYPEMTAFLRQKMTEKITHEQLAGKTPNLKTRMGLSLFLGVPLSSEMTPQAMTAIQNVFKNPGAQPQQGNTSPPASKTKDLTKIGQGYLTANAAAASRQQKQ
jgi:hypothetical protein